MTNVEELEGTTLNVYSCMVKEDKPLGPRETMRLAGLSSPSVAHWHLQKLETLGLITKNEYGEYAIKEKINISGHLWVGKTLVPRLICYAFFFVGILVVETLVIALPFLQMEKPQFVPVLFNCTDGYCNATFLTEGMWLRKKTRNENGKKKQVIEITVNLNYEIWSKKEWLFVRTVAAAFKPENSWCSPTTMQSHVPPATQSLE